MDLKTFFKEEVKPTLGCTEPGAVAYASSVAAGHLGRDIRRIELRLSSNIYKNGAGVGIPGARGLRGNLLAAALGALAGNAKAGLMALDAIGDEDVVRARAMLADGLVTQVVVSDVPDVYVEATLHDGEGMATAIIAGRHDSLVELRINGEVEHLGTAECGAVTQPMYIQQLLRQDMDSLWELAGLIDRETREFLLTGADMNLKVAEKGLEEPWGLGVGHALWALGQENDLVWRLKGMSAAAVDVRMGGGPFAVMSSAGSGNHGITAIVPVVVAARHWEMGDAALAEALALSHLLTGYIKAHTGRLTPTCGCAVAAGVGATAAMVRLRGGTPDQARAAAASLLASTLGMVCDGAKGSCAMKVSTAAGEAYTSAMIALAGGGFTEEEGLLSPNLPAMAKAVGDLSKIGLAAVDSVILRLMQEKLCD